jgi:predicted PurR-regulated permease PerM
MVPFGLFAWHIAQVSLIVFSGVLLAIFLGASASWLDRHLSIGYLPCLALVILLLAAAAAGFGWLIGPNVDNEVNQLAERLPEALARIRDALTSQHWVQVIMEAAPTASSFAPTPQKLLGPVTSAFFTAVGAVLYVAQVIVMAIYLAVDPGIYRRGLLLFPGSGRARGREVLDSLGHALRWWLVGRISAMLVVAILTTIGLAIIAMTMALALRLIAELLSFIPFIGPVVAAVPAVLIGFVQTPFMAAAVIIVLVQMLYVQNVLGNRVRILGDRESS